MKQEIFRFRTAGYSDNEVLRVDVKPRQLSVDVGPASCGVISDGIMFRHDQEGEWVLDFADLEKIYLAAKSVRALSVQEGE